MDLQTTTNLDTMTFADLETYKSHLDMVRRRILALQNAQSRLFLLPGELRNKIFHFAMYAELLDRKKTSRQSIMYREPSFFATSRQIKAECTGVWFNDVLVWEEFDSTKKEWRRLGMEEVREMCAVKTREGKHSLVTQMAHCDLERTRERVEGSCSICPRKGLVRVETGGEFVVPQLRWWVW